METYELVSSGDFSEASDYDSSEVAESSESSEVEDLDKHKIARDFWLRKETNLGPKKRRQRKKETDARRFGEKKADAPGSEDVKLGAKALAVELTKPSILKRGTRSNSFETASDLLRIRSAAANAELAALVDIHVFRFLRNALEEAFGETEHEKIWKVSADCLGRSLSFLESDVKSKLADFDSIRDDLEKKETKECDSEDKAISENEHKERFAKISEMAKSGELLNSICGFLLSLSAYLENRTKSHSTLEQLESDVKKEEVLRALVKRAKSVFTEAGDEKTTLLLSEALLNICFQDISPKPKSDFDRTHFSVEEFKAHNPLDLAFFVLSKSPSTEERSRMAVLLQLATLYSVNDFPLKAHRLVRTLGPLMGAFPEDERLRVLFNRASALLAVSLFRNGLFDDCARLCQAIFPVRRTQIGQARDGNANNVSALRHFDVEDVEAAHYFSSLFVEAEQQALVAAGRPLGDRLDPENGLVRVAATRKSKSIFAQNGVALRDFAVRCLDAISKADWKSFVEEMDQMCAVSAPMGDFWPREALLAKAKESSLKVFCLRFGGNFRNLSVARLERRFCIKEDKVRELLREISLGNGESSDGKLNLGVRRISAIGRSLLVGATLLGK
ncbi:Translation initiation factor 3 subunit c [Bonamia ostreae]|uniref:Translation initiation factor 3 subunit c n=1 Tax=Bonamia ostreae TaxID=126728 RepID=A0ABV2AFF0_9EUKA